MTTTPIRTAADTSADTSAETSAETSWDADGLSAKAREHLWMHFTRLSSYANSPVPTIVRGEGARIFDVHGKSSLTHMPDLPCCSNLYFEGAIGNRAWPLVIVVRRWPWRIDSGRSLSYHSFIFGL